MMALKRKPFWDTEDFDRFLRERAHMPFVWGGNDCALFAADGILAITGVDIAADFRGLYSDEAGSLRAIRQVTGGTSVELAAQHCADRFGLEEWKYPLQAQRGDLVVLVESGREIAGLVHLNGREVVAVGEDGLKLLPLSAVLRAWHY